MGRDPAIADELLALILIGFKRATACLAHDVEAGNEMMAQVGGHVVLLDGDDRPRACGAPRRWEVKPLRDVDDAFAWDEGEGERTGEDWLALHERCLRVLASTKVFPSMRRCPLCSSGSAWSGHWSSPIREGA